MTAHQQADKGSQAACGTYEHTEPMNTPATGGELAGEPMEYDLLAEQVEALADAMDGVSDAGSAFLHGAQTALRATVGALE